MCYTKVKYKFGENYEKKILKLFIVLFVVMLSFVASSYYFGSDVFNVESIINLIENKQSTSVLKIDDSKYTLLTADFIIRA